MFCDKKDEIFCKSCFIKYHFVSKNLYLNSAKGRQVEGPEQCIRCGAMTYLAERVMTRAGFCHTSCLSCVHCSKSLDPGNFADGPNKSVFCRPCYAVLHGHRSRSRSRAPADVKQFLAEENDPNRCQGCSGKIFEPEKVTTCFGSFHAACFKCAKCEKNLLHSPVSACSRNGLMLCKQCFNREISQSRKEGNEEDGSLNYAKSIAESHVIPAQEGDPDRCPRCSGKGRIRKEINLSVKLFIINQIFSLSKCKRHLK